MQRPDIVLGSTVRDQVTGFTGVAVARTIHLNRCDRIHIQPPVGADGKIPDCHSVDILTLIVLAPPAPDLIPTVHAPEKKVGGFTERVTNN